MTEPQTLDQGKTARGTWLFALALILIALLLYRPAWHGQPVWDDDAHITHPELRSWHGLVQIWTQIGATQQYYPLVHTAFWIEQKLWDDSFLGYHLVNILLHGATAVVLLQILLRLKIPGAWLGAALFALHPVQVESVAWISEFKNTLSGAFFFGSLLAYLRFDERRTAFSYVGSLVLFILGLLCKTAIAPLPGAIAVILWWKRGQIRFRDDLLPLIPFFLLGLLAGSFTALFERIFVGAAGSEFHLSILQRCLIAGRDFWFYLFKLAWPTKLTFIYPRWSVSSAVWWQYLFPIGVLLLLAYAWRLRRRNRGFLAAALIFLGLLLPALGFVDVFPFLYSFVADHFQYLACAAPLTLFAAGVAVGVQKIAPTAKNFLGLVVSLALLSTLGFLSWRQAHDYRDVETLWRTTIARNPSCWMAYSNLGSLLSGMGLTDEAIQNFRKALELRPDQTKDRNNLGKALLQQGRFAEAMDEFQAALRISPTDPVTENNIGAAYLQKDDVENALDHLGKAVREGPRN